jgi:hypothetical protein
MIPSRKARFVSALRTSLKTALETLREIFDESAYARFLNRTSMTSSTAAYAAFSRELDDAKARRPKCC